MSYRGTVEGTVYWKSVPERDWSRIVGWTPKLVIQGLIAGFNVLKHLLDA